ncbi:unnamed protein product, partial [Effrenium voratum]
ELFRRFPSPENWGGHYLEPDLAMHGVLRDPEAALFVEYDGYWRHAEEEGIALDAAKNAALLAYAPEGSYVVRINHAALKDVRPQDNVLWLTVSTWRSGDDSSLLAMLEELTHQISAGLQCVLRRSIKRRLTRGTGPESGALSIRARDFASSEATQGNSTEEIRRFVAMRGYDIEEHCWNTVLVSLSIEEQLDPMLLWLEGRGFSKMQLAKLLANKPHMFRSSIEDTLKPRADWLLSLGLSQAQLAKVVAAFPSILGFSIEQNLQPTTDWILGLGLSQAQLAKVVAGHPKILGLSIEQNLRPTADWIRGLGLSQAQLAKVVADHPHILSYSVEQNLKLKLELLSMESSELAVLELIAKCPRVFSYSYQRLTKPASGSVSSQHDSKAAISSNAD